MPSLPVLPPMPSVGGQPSITWGLNMGFKKQCAVLFSRETAERIAKLAPEDRRKVLMTAAKILKNRDERIKTSSQPHPARTKPKPPG